MGPSGIGTALKEVTERLEPVFAAWQANGAMRPEISVDVAIWQVIGPLSSLRLTYMHAEASEQDIALGTTLARQHLEEMARRLTVAGGSKK